MRLIAWLRPVLAACALLGIQAGAVAADGPHCDLARAPADAGYNTLMGVPVRVFPLPDAIGSKFSGCQSAWMREEGSAEEDGSLQMRIVFEQGVPVQMLGPDQEPMMVLRCKTQPGQDGARTRYRCPPLEQTLPLAGVARHCLRQAGDGAPEGSRGLYSLEPGCR